MNKNISLFYGEEDFLVEEKINKIKSQIENPSLNVEVLDGKKVSSEILSSAFQTAPMFGGQKLVVVKELEIDPEKQEALLSLLEDIPAEVRIVFHCSKIDRRSRFYKQIDKLGEAVDFKTFAPWEQAELLNWVKQRARQSGKEISGKGALLLQEICGNNLRLLAGEIEKLTTYIGEEKEIKEGDVLSLASSGETSVFKLLDVLREKNLKKALPLLQILLINKGDLFQLLYLLITQYRLMLQIKSLAGREKDPNKIARLVGGSPFFVKKCSERLETFTLPELKKDLELLLEASLKLKSGESQMIIFELLLTALCGN